MDITTLLHNINEELESSEIAALKFLCKDHIKRKKLETVRDGRDLFLRLEEQGLLEDVSVVVELLFTIKRYDLLKVLGTSRARIEKQLQMQVDAGCVISSYRKLLYELSEDVTEENLEAIKFLSNISQVRFCKSFLDVLTEMEKQELLADDNLGNLEHLLKTCNQQLAVRVQEYAARRNAGSTRFTDRKPSTTSNFGTTENVFLPSSPSVPELPSSTVPQNNSEEQNSLFLDAPLSNAPDGDMYYSMRRRPRGHCLIINNFNFKEARDNEKKLDDRKGTHQDADELNSVFKWLHFEVSRHDDLTGEDLLNVAKDFGKRDHSHMDAFVCCILSHGEKGTVIGTDGCLIPIRQITQPFQSSSCSSLAGKPKLFFIQACQGQAKQRGKSIQADGGPGEDTSKSMKQPSGGRPLRPQHGQEVGQGFPSQRQSRLEDAEAYDVDAAQIQQDVIPDDSDFLLGMATVEDYQSFRHISNGSIYIQELCHQLKSCCPRNESILNILTRVNRAVSSRDYMSYKQMPEPRYTLTKILILPVD